MWINTCIYREYNALFINPPTTYKNMVDTNLGGMYNKMKWMLENENK